MKMRIAHSRPSAMNLLRIPKPFNFPLLERKGVCKNCDDDDGGKAGSLATNKLQTNKKAFAGSPCTAKALISSGFCPLAA
jgi:hypothetical protein